MNVKLLPPFFYRICLVQMKITKRFEHLVTFVEDEMLKVAQVQLLGSDEGQNTSGGSNHDVRAVRLQSLLVLLDIESTKEHSNLLQ